MKNIFLFLLITVFGLKLNATEGMWVPSLIDMFYSNMKTYGLKLSAEQIYSTNHSSLKDAVIQFNGGCTAEIVSNKGLILTNHHCGFDAIQKHSSLEHDYLKNGFWAKNFSEELPCPWLHVTFVKRIDDVTEKVLEGVTDDLSEKEKKAIIRENIKHIEKEGIKGSNYKAKIKPFNLGNQYFMLVTEDFNDIRLVGTPPSAIGKYGGDTDNWVWPRHTGDFSVFRIYADANNKSAEYSTTNVPYQPDYTLPISLLPKKQGDFTMVYGFPGSTDQHYSNRKLEFIINKERPARIAMRQKTLDILKPKMNNDDLIRIQYASKQARIANAWKKWIGQIKGLKELHAIDKKAQWEEIYMAKAAEKTEWKQKYFPIIKELANLQNENEKYEFARSMFIEYFYVGPEFIRFADAFNAIAINYEKFEKEGKLKAELEKLKSKTKSFFKNYNKDIDKEIFNALTPLYISYVDSELLPENLNTTWRKTGEKIFKKSIILNEQKLSKLLDNFSKKSAKKLQKDVALIYSNSLMKAYFKHVRTPYGNYRTQEKELMKTYLEGIMVMFPDKNLWPDANSTMRITYGKIDGSAPYDGMMYTHYTTIDGIMQKYDPSNPDFQLTDRFIELYKRKDFGPYMQDGELWVCFTASNHTTGGNSGSPVISADGYLMGINFDRSWESTMSDFMFDESRCRNIAVDIRYVLWVIDKYGEAHHLIEEMDLITIESIKKKNRERAENSIRKITKQLIDDPNNFELLYARAVGYQQLGMYKEAVQDLDVAVKLNPYLEKAHLLKAQTFWNSGQFSDIIPVLNKVLKLNPQNADAYLLAGKVRFKKGEINKAIYNFNKALDINPEFSEAYVLIGSCYVSQGNLHKACDKFQTAKQHGQNVSIQNLCQ
ncbi:MAG TPA: tetratricopeptide repeat protein [Crocinitomix sp.]|nr:tetratricopeptide repeat protein [Crocinitomix sp.]